jgi:hypothetical protein
LLREEYPEASNVVREKVSGLLALWEVSLAALSEGSSAV